VRPTQVLLERVRDEWGRVLRHPFPRRLAAGVGAAGFREWLGLEAALAEAMAGLVAPVVPKAPKPHRYVLAQALLFLVEEAEWLETQARGRPPLPEATARLARLRPAPRTEWKRVATEFWLGGSAYFHALRAVRPEDEWVRAYWERRTSAIIAAFLHDFAELADLALARYPGAAAVPHARRVLAGLAGFWDLGLGLLGG